MPYQPLRCPTCGSTKIIVSENKRFFCVSCEGWFVWKDELAAKQSEPILAPTSFVTVPALPKAQTVLPTTPTSEAHPTRAQVSRTPQSPDIITDWQTPAGYVAISIGVLAFVSSWLANGREATPFDGFLNPLFYIGVFLGWYWLNEGKQIGGTAPAQPPLGFGVERQQELIRLRQREQEQARKQKERERQEAERRQRKIQEALRLQKEREQREAETRQRGQLQNAPPNLSEGEFGTAGVVCLFLVLGFIVLIIALASLSEHQNSTLSASTETAEEPPVPDHSVSKGSFSVWTEPAAPEPGQQYAIMIQVNLKGDVDRIPRSDFSGNIMATDGYKDVFGGPSEFGYYTVKDQTVRFRALIVPGASELVRDVITIESKLLGEKQVLEIVFKSSLKTAPAPKREESTTRPKESENYAQRGQESTDEERKRTISESSQATKLHPPHEKVLVGTVLNWKTTNTGTLVEIDLGSDDGIVMKQRLNIYRATGKGSHLGRIEIVHIVNERSVGILYSGYGVSKGDYVTTAEI